jgi:hypothetical protein
MKILYISLFPKFNNCHEIENLEYFVNSSEFYHIKDLFTYRLFSAHDEMITTLRTIYGDNTTQTQLFDLDNQFQIEKLNLVFPENIDELRAHEISKSKQIIYTFMCFKKIVNQYDYVFYNDADIRIDARDIYECCKVLELKNNINDTYFFNIPYVLKLTRELVEESFGSFILPSSITAYTSHIIERIYKTYEKDNIIYREGAPDWIIRQLLLKSGYKEIRGESCHTQHYISQNKYYTHDSRKLEF